MTDEYTTERQRIIEHGVRSDQHGVLRWRENRIISDLLLAAQPILDLNKISARTQTGRYSEMERRELYRLIGYSLCGYMDVFGEPNVGIENVKRARRILDRRAKGE